MRVPIFFQGDIVKSEIGKGQAVTPEGAIGLVVVQILSTPFSHYPSLTSASPQQERFEGAMVSNRYSMNNFSAEKIQEGDPQLLVPGIVHDISPEQRPIVPLRTPPRLTINSKANTMRVRELKADKMVEAWDKIGVLTSEVTKAIMKKQADSIAKRYRQEGSHHDEDTSTEESRSKKQRLEDNQLSDDVIVNLPEENWSASLTRCIDRMARMSKLIMEIEYCHRLLREEMVEIQNDLAS